ncbi:hypothetical protein HDU92_008170 [Lobulomyces angularis]|nr:hypothetical protein HDU92_008170 [Lobulomyces angularis]
MQNFFLRKENSRAYEQLEHDFYFKRLLKKRPHEFPNLRSNLELKHSLSFKFAEENNEVTSFRLLKSTRIDNASFQENYKNEGKNVSVVNNVPISDKKSDLKSASSFQGSNDSTKRNPVRKLNQSEFSNKLVKEYSEKTTVQNSTLMRPIKNITTNSNSFQQHVLQQHQSFQTAGQKLESDLNIQKSKSNPASFQKRLSSEEVSSTENQNIHNQNYQIPMKRTLGTFSKTQKKFVSPLLQNNSNQSNNGAVSNENVFSDTVEDPEGFLKNIDKKMVEMIQNEIMVKMEKVECTELAFREDIAGLEHAKKTILEIVVWPMLRPDIFTGLRGPPKGLLLFGPPGTGKTLIGKCIASQSNATFFSISSSSLTSKWVGEGEKMVRALFAVARLHQPSVIFMDEIDSLLTQRTDGEVEASRRIKTEFLVQFDGCATSSNDRILLIGATNRPWEIDEAARRRFRKKLYIPLPEANGRESLFRRLLRSESNSLTDLDIEKLVSCTEGYSGSDCDGLIREACLGPVREISDIRNITIDQVREVRYIDFENALSQVRASVSEKDLLCYLNWDSQHGSGSK